VNRSAWRLYAPFFEIVLAGLLALSLGARAGPLTSAGSAPKPGPDQAAVEAALQTCRGGKRAEAVAQLASDLQKLPQARGAVDLLVRLAREQKLEAMILEQMESWTIPPESDEVGLPSAWLVLRGRLLRQGESELAQGLLIQALGKTRQLAPSAADELARLVDASQEAAVVQKLRELGATAANAALFSVLLAERRGKPDLALDLLNPVLRSAPDDDALLLLRARLLRRLGRDAEALEAAEAAVLGAKRSADVMGMPEIVLLYGDLLAIDGRSAEAQRAFALAEEAANQACDPSLVVRAEVARGELLEKAGQILEAEKLYRTAIGLQHETGAAHAALARLLAEVGSPIEALEEFSAAAPLLEGQERQRDLGTLQADWAEALANVARYSEALRHARSGLELAAAAGDRPLACRLLLTAARTWLSLRSPRHAQTLLDAAGTIAGKDGSPALRAQVDCVEAESRSAEGKAEETRAAARSCGEGADRGSDPDLGLQARTLEARALIDLGRATEANALLNGTGIAELDATSPAARREVQAAWLLERGRAAAQTPGQEAAAERAFDAAFALAAPLGRQDVRWRVELARARKARAAGRGDEAVAALRRAVAVLEETRADLNAPGQMADRQAARLEPYDELVAALLPAGGATPQPTPKKGQRKAPTTTAAAPETERQAQAWEAADRRVGRRLRDLLPRPQEAAATPEERRLVEIDAKLARNLFWVHAAQAAPVFDAALSYHLEHWITDSGLEATRADELRAAARGQRDPKALQAFLGDLESRLSGDQASALSELAGLSPALSSLLAPRPAGLQAVQAGLAPDEAFLIYVLRPQETLALVATSRGFSMSRLAPWHDLAASADAFLQQLTRPPRPGQAFRPESGAALYQTLVQAPLTEAGVRPMPARLDIVGDGALLDLPFSALPRPAGGFLIEECLPTFLPASWWRLADTAPGSVGAAGSAVLFGAPFLPTPEDLGTVQVEGIGIPGASFTVSADLDERSPKIPSSSAVEVQVAAERLGGGARAFIEGDASEEATSGGALATAAVVHFAAPALGDGESAQAAGVLLARHEGGNEDGFLELSEIVRLRLTARLVTLTGSQPRSPGGVADLGAAFLVAGAHAVVESLWLAEEDANVYFVDKLYEKLAASGPGAALRAAQLHLLSGQVQDRQGRTLKRLAHPHFWAGYQLLGAP
jgi:CHAT domain-containing protein/Tfp pilus assembly protein PilF